VQYYAAGVRFGGERFWPAILPNLLDRLVRRLIGSARGNVDLKQTPSNIFHRVSPRKTIIMKTKRGKLMSPSLSTTSTPSTQVPIPIEDSLPSHGISIEDARKWKRLYNRDHEPLPLIHDDKFYRLLIDTTIDTDPADVEFESKVKSVMEERNARSRAKFEEQTYEILLEGAEFFQDPTQRSDFLSALDQQHTIHGFEAFIANCLPMLINARKLKHQQRSRTGRTRKKTVSPGVSKSSSGSIGQIGTRRSPRNRKPDTPPSK
jgi:hypothetical protein